MRTRKASIDHHFSNQSGAGGSYRSRAQQKPSGNNGGNGQYASSSLGPPGGLRSALGGICISSNSDPFCIVALLAVELPSLRQQVSTRSDTALQRVGGVVARTIAAGLRDGNIATIKPAALDAQCFISPVHGAMLSARAHGSSRLFSDVAQTALAAIRDTTR